MVNTPIRHFRLVAGVGAMFTLAACGTGPRETAATASPRPTPPPSRTMSQATGSAPTSRVPTEAQIKSAQQAVIYPAPVAQSAAGRQQQDSREHDAKPSRTTAPERVLQLAARATHQWLRYRIDGKAPDAAVIPHRVWDGVPPAAPSLRMKGRALTTNLHAFSAHPEHHGWIVSVSTRDPRLPTIVVDLKGPAHRASVRGISG
jgi:hypothetical protein